MLNLQKGQHTVFISEEGGVLNEKSVLYLDDCCHGVYDDSIRCLCSVEQRSHDR